jgi:hypothetical protein
LSPATSWAARWAAPSRLGRCSRSRGVPLWLEELLDFFAWPEALDDEDACEERELEAECEALGACDTMLAVSGAGPLLSGPACSSRRRRGGVGRSAQGSFARCGAHVLARSAGGSTDDVNKAAGGVVRPCAGCYGRWRGPSQPGRRCSRCGMGSWPQTGRQRARRRSRGRVARSTQPRSQIQQQARCWAVHIVRGRVRLRVACRGRRVKGMVKQHAVVSSSFRPTHSCCRLAWRRPQTPPSCRPREPVQRH